MILHSSAVTPEQPAPHNHCDPNQILHTLAAMAEAASTPTDKHFPTAARKLAQWIKLKPERRR